MLRDDKWFRGFHNPKVACANHAVVDPVFFPGGDIGRPAVNDIAMSGATPLYLRRVPPGGRFPIADLKRILESMRAAAAEAGVEVVTGDTKVVQKGSADKIFHQHRWNRYHRKPSSHLCHARAGWR
jgi:hydrogenase maturation factor